MSNPLIKIARDGKTIGEYSLADLGLALRAKTVLPTDHFWRQGMKDWERVSVIATEAEASIPIEGASPPPPTSNSSTNGSEASSEASIAGRLFFVLGAISVPVSVIITLINVSDVSERMSVFRSLDIDNPLKLKIARGVDNVVGQQLETAFWFAVLWAIARLGYYVLKGKTTPNDEAKIKSGRSLFGVSLFCLLLAVFYSGATTGQALRFAERSERVKHR